MAKLSAHCNRVPVEDGHMECVSIKLRTKASREELIEAWREFTPLHGQGLPSAPEQPVEFVTAEDRPQPRLDRMRGNGMASTVGRLRPCSLFDWKFTVLSHNTIRGAAGAAILNAEISGEAGQAGARQDSGKRSCGGPCMKATGPTYVVMKFGGTSVEDAVAIDRTARIVAGRRAQGRVANRGGQRDGQGHRPADRRRKCSRARRPRGGAGDQRKTSPSAS